MNFVVAAVEILSIGPMRLVKHRVALISLNSVATLDECARSLGLFKLNSDSANLQIRITCDEHANHKRLNEFIFDSRYTQNPFKLSKLMQNAIKRPLFVYSMDEL